MQLNEDKAVAVCVQYFLRSLMQLEREKYGWSMKDAATKAVWPLDTWRELETHVHPIEPHQWINICAVLDLSDDRLARRLHAFVKKNPVLLVAAADSGQLTVFEKAITSPRLIRNQDIFTFSLAPVRTKLFDILALYAPDGDSLIDAAQKRDLYHNQPDVPVKSTFKRRNTKERNDGRRARLARIVIDKIADDKLDTLESALELIHKNQCEEVDRAVQIMSIVLK
ncbi:MAG: hypothetical protein JXX29_01900 [Deltaproteobacteria bacterium]|nr:hypothetical protein [Deltaproteobacteria bacterium]MBN2670394.1 hypothetical protein [Deltaproteobacteria bacterium]